MTLVNMREQGGRSLSVTCELCHHVATMNVDRFGDACTDCGIVGADVRPNRQERPARESITGMQWR